jgi:DNA (cytosine-5)-methyltransferase 1
LEALGYAAAAADLGAASVGAPHIRQRLWWMADASGIGRQRRPYSGRSTANETKQRGEGLRDVEPRSNNGRLGVPTSAGSQGSNEPWKRVNAQRQAAERDVPISNTNPLHGFWRDADWLLCRDGKWRPVEPGTFPLAHGAPARVGRLRAYGNAIVAPLAAEFIAAVMDCQP